MDINNFTLKPSAKLSLVEAQYKSMTMSSKMWILGTFILAYVIFLFSNNFYATYTPINIIEVYGYI